MRILAIVVVVVLFGSLPSYAAGPVSFGLQATGANLNVEGPFKDAYGFGFGGGVHLDINLPVLLAVRVQGDFVTFSPDEGKYRDAVAAQFPGLFNPADLSIDGGRINILSAFVNGKLTPLPIPVLKPYATGGVGIASLSVTDLTVKYQGNQAPVAGMGSDTNFSANLGVGADLDLYVVTIFLEVRYTWIFASGGTSTYVPVSLGVTF